MAYSNDLAEPGNFVAAGIGGGFGLVAAKSGKSLKPQRQKELNLEKADQSLEALIEAVPLAILVLDHQGRIRLWNRTASSVFGWKASEVTGHKPPFLSQNQQPEFQEFLVRSLQGEAVWGMGTYHHRDGMALDCSFSISPLPGSQDKVDGVLLVMEDITERRQTEAELFKANEELKAWIYEFSRRNRDITLLNQMGDLLQGCNTLEEAYTYAGQHLSRLFSRESGAFFRYNPDKNILTKVKRWGKNSPGVEKFSLDECWALKTGQEHSVQDPGSGSLCGHLTGVSHGYVCLPMIAHGETLGLLVLLKNLQEGPSKEILSDSKHRLAITAARQIALSLSNLKLRNSLREQAIRDPLTGLFNRRYLQESLEREIFRVQRKGAPLSLIMMDLDLFKHINTSFGHDGGDTLIRNMGDLLRSHIRREDIACRYGGEEFIVILPEASLEVSLARAEKIRQGVQKLKVEYQGRSLGPVTASLGVAVFPDHGTDGQALIQGADAALYRAKEEGRNRVVTAA